VDEREQALLDRLSCEVHGLHLEPVATARVGRFLDLLEVWNPRLRLTGDRDRPTLLRKHVVDALACVRLLPDAGAVLDVGTGAGFPGVVLACIRPDLDVTLLDSRERAVSFLGEAARAIPLPRARALCLRAEEAANRPEVVRRQTLVVSRAIRLDAFLGWAAPLLASDGQAVAMQTPRLDRRTAEKCAARHGLRVLELHDYRLPDGEARRLVVFR
jgi:16S rRNA (guanine527-N7)-methyltransferase